MIVISHKTTRCAIQLENKSAFCHDMFPMVHSICRLNIDIKHSIAIVYSPKLINSL